MEEIEVLSCIRGYHAYTKTCGQQQLEKQWCVKESLRTLLTDKFIQVKNFRTLSLKQNLFTDEKKANYGI